MRTYSIPQRAIKRLINHKRLDFLPDKLFLRIFYWAETGEILHLKHPRNFNEKTQYLKIYDRNPLYTKLVDKYEAKEFAASVMGEEAIFKTLGVWDKFADIDFDLLPNEFVLKCTHDSGGLVICKNKAELDMEETKRKIEESLSNNYFFHGREWPYKNVPHRIIAEEYMVDESGYELKDYKVYVFGGKAKYIHVDYDRFTNHRRNFYDTMWNYIPFTTLYPTDKTHVVETPECLNEMIKQAEALADKADTPAFVRVDFYVIKNKVYFGEMTFYHGAGIEDFMPPEYNKVLGDLIDIKDV